jgi:micrococcal nuclease
LKRRNSAALITGAIAVIIAVPAVVSWTQSPATDPGDVPARGDVETGFVVERIVDGDTLIAVRGGERIRVRLLGIDTPESVHPSKPVECFGPEASVFAKQALDNQAIALEFDSNQPRRDRFDRTLAYVWFEDSSGKWNMFNLRALEEGFAERYRNSGDLLWQMELAGAERSARSGDLGLWGECSPEAP